MEAKEVLLALRTKRGFSQEELAERLFVTRQAVSRWEMGETLPGPETLQRLSALYDVSINTLLGQKACLPMLRYALGGRRRSQPGARRLL